MKYQLFVGDEEGNLICKLNAPTADMLIEKLGAYERNKTNHD